MFGKITAGFLLVAVVSAAGFYSTARSKLVPLDDAAREQAPGEFIELSDGLVHYRWHGPEDGDVTVLVHGFSTPSFVWAGLLPHLVRSGMRVLTYDNYGRGYSDRPDTPNDAELFDRQLLELLDSQNITAPVNLVGYSMGGAIATYFTSKHHERVAKLGLIAPAGFKIEPGLTAAIMRVPMLGDWLMAISGRSVVLEMMSLPENQGRAIPDLLARYEDQMQYEGYLRSLLSTLRHFPMGDMKAEYVRVGRRDIPVTAIWGDQDTVVRPDNAVRLRNAIPHAKVDLIAGGSHAITYSEPFKVSESLIRLFTSGESNTPAATQQR